MTSRNAPGEGDGARWPADPGDRDGQPPSEPGGSGFGGPGFGDSGFGTSGLGDSGFGADDDARSALTADPSRALAARLLLMLPLVVGTVLTEAIFAAGGAATSDISLAAAVVAFLLCWQGVAWALRSWVAVLLTFVPAVMITLGAAMVAAVEPVGGAILLTVGGTLLLAVVWVRVAAPSRRWTPGWSASGGSGGADAPEFDMSELDALEPPRNPTARAGVRESSDAAAHTGRDRRPPSWDTSATDIAARDALVLALCQRGGAAGPTVATLEEFFTGNGDPRSIAAPLRGSVPLSTFAAVLHTVRARPDVAEVLVQVEPLGQGEYPAGSWPAAGSIRVVGAVDPDDLDMAMAPLRAAPAVGPLPATELADGRPAPDGVSEYAVWWA
ncbi:MAG: hypothetical protein J0I11_03730 [Actinobacteria bacterium]|nr:hypothetical protein [Actinomycetota bacterium]